MWLVSFDWMKRQNKKGRRLFKWILNVSKRSMSYGKPIKGKGTELDCFRDGKKRQSKCLLFLSTVCICIFVHIHFSNLKTLHTFQHIMYFIIKCTRTYFSCALPVSSIPCWITNRPLPLCFYQSTVIQNIWSWSKLSSRAAIT